MSCAISTPTAIRPASPRSTPISSSIFMATTVDDSAMMKPRMIVSEPEAPESVAIPSASTMAASNCPAITRSACRSDSTKAFTDSSMPMKKSSTTTPISASTVTFSELEIRPAPVGPSATPAAMKPTSGGCRSHRKKSPSRAATATTAAMPTSAVAWPAFSATAVSSGIPPATILVLRHDARDAA